MKITRINNCVITDWYMKPTASGRCIHYLSHHPLSQKKAIVYNLIDRAILISHPSFIPKNTKKIRSLLQANGYPLEFINNHICIRLQHIQNQNLPTQSKTDVAQCNKIVLPFNSYLAPHFNSLFKKHQIIPIYRIKNKHDGMIRLGKDRISNLETPYSIYKIHCDDCKST